LLDRGTDSKHWVGRAKNAYRFFPFRIMGFNKIGFCGIKEHIEVENDKEAIDSITN